jgi:hypothetical protein
MVTQRQRKVEKFMLANGCCPIALPLAMLKVTIGRNAVSVRDPRVASNGFPVALLLGMRQPRRMRRWLATAGRAVTPS